MMAITKVVYHEAAEDALRNGPIARDAEERGREVAREFRSRVSVRTGKLQGSAEAHSAEDAGGDEVAVAVSADATNAGFPYVIPLEFGAVHMAPEPALIPALEAVFDG